MYIFSSVSCATCRFVCPPPLVKVQNSSNTTRILMLLFSNHTHFSPATLFPFPTPGNTNLLPFFKMLSFVIMSFYKYTITHTFIYNIYLSKCSFILLFLQGSQKRLPYFRPVNRVRDVKWLNEGHMFSSTSRAEIRAWYLVLDLPPWTDCLFICKDLVVSTQRR